MPEQTEQPANLKIIENWFNATENYGLGDSGVYETYTDQPGELFRSLQREYGKCISKVYFEPSSGSEPVAVGWVFQKRKQYDDSRDCFLLETWVSVVDYVIPKQYVYRAI